jgi:hypothetical protein
MQVILALVVGCLLINIYQQLQKCKDTSRYSNPRTRRLHITMSVSSLFVSTLASVGCMSTVFVFSPGQNVFAGGTEATCTSFARLSTGGYIFHCFFMYIFLWAKQRLVRPLSRVSLLEKLILVGTMGVPAFAVIFIIFTSSVFGASGECYPRVSWELTIVMIVIDTSLSVCFLSLFMTPIIEMRHKRWIRSISVQPKKTMEAGDGTTSRSPPLKKPTARVAPKRIVTDKLVSPRASSVISIGADLMFAGDDKIDILLRDNVVVCLVCVVQSY